MIKHGYLIFVPHKFSLLKRVICSGIADLVIYNNIKKSPENFQDFF